MPYSLDRDAEAEVIGILYPADLSLHGGDEAGIFRRIGDFCQGEVDEAVFRLKKKKAPRSDILPNRMTAPHKVVPEEEGLQPDRWKW